MADSWLAFACALRARTASQVLVTTPVTNTAKTAATPTRVAAVNFWSAP
jgi:hypothetical protein